MKNFIRTACVIFGLLLASISMPVLAQTNLAASPDGMEQALSTGWWGGGLNAQSGPAAVSFKFGPDAGGKLGAKIFFKPGKVGYDAYVLGQNYPGDTKVDPKDIGGSLVTFTDDGGFTLNNKFIWKFTKLADGSFQCVRTTADAHQYSDPPFIVRRLPAK